MIDIQNKAALEPSIYQTNLWSWIKDPNPQFRVAVVQAVPGSGKTTVIVEGAKFIPSTDRVAFVAFAKSNVLDLKAKLPANAEAATLNSVGNRAWLKFIGKYKIDINKDLNYELIGEAIDPETGKLATALVKMLGDKHRAIHGLGIELDRYNRLLSGVFTEEVYDISRLVALAKNCGIVPRKIIEKTGQDYNVLMEDSRDNWNRLIESYDLSINFPDVAVEIARMVLIKSIIKAGDVIDYDSQLWLPVIHRVPFMQYDWVLIDELQDLNAIQMEMITAMMKPGGRAIGVGDSFQSIYGFRGSLSSSMDHFKGMFNAQEFPLSICYRCAKDIVAHAKEVCPHIEHFEGQSKGSIMDVSRYSSTLFTKHDAIICRNTAPLVSLAYKLSKAKFPCKILGRDIEHGLVKLINRCKPKDGDLQVMKSRMQDVLNRQLEKDRKNGSYVKSEAIKDRIDSIAVFLEESNGKLRTSDDLIKKINLVFSMERLNKEQMTILATIHKAKGGEWPSVYILESQLMPSKKATSKEAIRQEMNAILIARTRAKKKLGYIYLSGYDENCKEPVMSELQKELAVA